MGDTTGMSRWSTGPVLVTGATGFLGRALVRRLSREGAQVLALYRTERKRERIEGLPGVEPVAGDLTDREQMRTVCTGCRSVIHAAAALVGPPQLQQEVNVEGSAGLVATAAAAGVRRLVHVSSVAVYGFRPGAVLDEATDPDPAGYTYSRTKAEAERAVRTAAAGTGLEVAIVRPGTIYGPRARTWTGLLFRWAQRRPLVLPGSGRGTIPYIHVDDVVDLGLLCAVHPAAAGGIFNAVMDPPPTLRQVLGAWADLAGNPWRLSLPVPLVRLAARLAAVTARPGTVRREAPAIARMLVEPARWPMDRAREVLGWRPRVGLEEGIAGCVPWLREKGLLKD
jgi:nucleoside-diphosphate-sugar epimerase